MGVIRVTTRPYYYAKLEEETIEQEPEIMEYPVGKISLSFRVGGTGKYLSNMQQQKLKPIVSSVLHAKGEYVRDYCGSDDRGFYTWKELFLHGNQIVTRQFRTNDMEKLLQLMQALDNAGFFPDGEILITYYPEKRDISLLTNLVNILKSRKRLIEQALSLTEHLQLVMNRGVALSVSLSAFSYTAVEAVAFLIEQACRMAQSTGKSRMKPCDMSNPKYQMRSWLLRLGFIGEQYERPRKTLLDGLSGDAAFFSEDQKNRAAARRKARKMNEVVNVESA